MNGTLFDIGPSGPKNKVRGYASTPGSGPAGETCGSCRHCVRNPYAPRFFKCALLEHAWTHSISTDIRFHSPACRLWERQSCAE